MVPGGFSHREKKNLFEIHKILSKSFHLIIRSPYSSKMLQKRTQEKLDNCLVLLYDHAALPVDKIEYDTLVELFIRNSLKVPSTSK